MKTIIYSIHKFDKPYLEGLWYPIIVAGVCFVIGMLYINKKMTNIEE